MLAGFSTTTLPLTSARRGAARRRRNRKAPAAHKTSATATPAAMPPIAAGASWHEQSASEAAATEQLLHATLESCTEPGTFGTFGVSEHAHGPAAAPARELGGSWHKQLVLLPAQELHATAERDCARLNVPEAFTETPVLVHAHKPGAGVHALSSHAQESPEISSRSHALHCVLLQVADKPRAERETVQEQSPTAQSCALTLLMAPIRK